MTNSQKEAHVGAEIMAYENIKGVFADLDDGGLTDEEALEQIRDLVGAKRGFDGVDRVTITYLVPVELRINLVEGSVERAELNSGDVWGELPNQTYINADTNQDLDDDQHSSAIERAKAIADEGGWVYDIQVN